MLSFLVIGLSGCGTTKKFSVNSTPAGAMLVQKKQRTGTSAIPVRDEVIGETPTTTNINFWNEKSSYKLHVEKRGYSSATMVVDQNSDLDISVELQRLENVSEEIVSKDELKSHKYGLLPLYVEVHEHSGVGRLDKIEFSEKLTNKVAPMMQNEIASMVGGEGCSLQMVEMDDLLKASWQPLIPELNNYVKKLDGRRLHYYSLPPLATDNVKGLDSFLENYRRENEDHPPYLLYVWTKCVSETKGRVAGNIALSILGGATQGYHAAVGTTFVWDPSAFNPSSGTLVMLYVIDVETSEVVYIEKYGFSDITDENALKNAVAKVSNFPVIEEK